MEVAHFCQADYKPLISGVARDRRARDRRPAVDGYLGKVTQGLLPGRGWIVIVGKKERPP
jgi:hypothetical protein